jgi:hypothetical protein
MRPLTLRLGYVFHLARDSQYDLDKRVHPRFRSVLNDPTNHRIVVRCGQKGWISVQMKESLCDERQDI